MWLPLPLQAWLLLLGHQDVPAGGAFALMPALTKILFFHAFFHGVISAHSRGDLRPPLPSLALSSHLGDGFQRSHPLDGGCLVQPCEHPWAPCWGPDPEGAEHPWDRERADRVLPWAAIWGGPGLTPARCLQGCILPWVQRGARIFFGASRLAWPRGPSPRARPYRGCLSAVFVLICSLRLLAAKLKLVEWENRGPLSPELFSLSARAAAAAHRAGATRWQDRRSTLGTPNLGDLVFSPPPAISLPQLSPPPPGFQAASMRVWQPEG